MNNPKLPELAKEYGVEISTCIALLKLIQVDGETMQYILEQVQQDDQMLAQLIMSRPLAESLSHIQIKIEIQS